MISRIVIGSRGSRLALVQAEWVKAELAILFPQLHVAIEIIKTSGDVKTDPLSVIGGKGVFTKELEDALLDKRIDVAVHSLKDLPTTLPEGLHLSAISKREDPRDALVLPDTSDTDCNSLRDLPPGTLVGTSSPRRLSQLSHLRPDLQYADVRGNVDTRLRKLDEGQYGALILASAGLNRLGLHERISLAISIDEMLPAVGQAALGVQTRTDDKEVNDVLAKLDHAPTHVACAAERSLLRALGGGCQLPIAGHATVFDSTVTLEGLVASRDGKTIVRDRIVGNVNESGKLGLRLAEQLMDAGAANLLGEDV